MYLYCFIFLKRVCVFRLYFFFFNLNKIFKKNMQMGRERVQDLCLVQSMVGKA